MLIELKVGVSIFDVHIVIRNNHTKNPIKTIEWFYFDPNLYSDILIFSIII